MNAPMSTQTDMGVTANAQLLLGYIGGCLGVAAQTRFECPFYELVDIDATSGCEIVRNVESGNTYRVSVVQLDGTE